MDNRIKWGRFYKSVIGLFLIFLINTAGIYGNGFVAQNYWVSQVEHFVGGFLVALSFSSFYLSNRSIFIGVAILGLMWELFEYLVTHSPPLFAIVSRILVVEALSISWPDTIMDLCLNFLGATLFVLLIKKRIN